MLTLKIWLENVSHFKSAKINNFLDPERARIRQIKWNYFNKMRRVKILEFKCSIQKFQSLYHISKRVISKVGGHIHSSKCREFWHLSWISKFREISYIFDFQPKYEKLWKIGIFTIQKGSYPKRVVINETETTRLKMDGHISNWNISLVNFQRFRTELPVSEFSGFKNSGFQNFRFQNFPVSELPVLRTVRF